MRVFFLFVVFYMLGVTQSVLPEWRLAGGVKIPLLLACVIYFAMRHEGQVASLAAVSGGLVHDIFSMFPYGASIVFFLAVRFVMQRSRKVVCTEALYPATVFGAAWSVLMQAFFFFLMLILDRRLPPLDTLLLKSVAAALMGWCAILLVFPLLAAFERFLGLEPKREEDRHVPV